MSFDAVANAKLDMLLALPSATAPKVSGAGFQVLPSAASAILLPPNGAAWLNGAYAQFTAGLAQATYIVGLAGWINGTANTHYEVDIAMGASGSEVVVSTVAFEFASNAGGSPPIFFPALIPIPASTRIACRQRDDNGNGGFVAKLIYVQQANWSGV